MRLHGKEEVELEVTRQVRDAMVSRPREVDSSTRDGSPNGLVALVTEFGSPVQRLKTVAMRWMAKKKAQRQLSRLALRK